MYAYVNTGQFGKARQTWMKLKSDIITFNGIKGKDYKIFEECFYDGDYLLSRTAIDFNKIRMQEILRTISALMKGKTHAYQKGDKLAVLQHAKDLYTDLIENYRAIFSRVSKVEQVNECRAFADVIGDDLMELRDMEPAFKQLNDHHLYVLYNAVRRQIGQCESVLPRLAEAFRMAQVKSKFENNFAILFERIEDLLAPIQTYDIASHEEEIIRLWKTGKTIPEIATELKIDVNALAVYMKEMDVNKLKREKTNATTSSS